MMRTVLPVLLAAALAACARHDGDDGFSLRSGDYWSSSTTRSFAIGLTAPLNVIDGDNYDRLLSTVACVEGCTIESSPSVAHPKFPDWRVTPTAARFRVRVAIPLVEKPVDLEASAVDAPLAGKSGGAPPPGVPVLVGTTFGWQLGPKGELIAWDPKRSKIDVTGPFVLASEPAADAESGELSVALRATGAGKGTLVHTNGTLSATYNLEAIAKNEVKALHAAKAKTFSFDEVANLSAPPTSPAMTVGENAWLWVVFETATGVVGIANVDESKAEPYAFFDLGDHGYQPFLTLVGKHAGTSNLELHVGDVSSLVEVVVQ